MGVTSGATIADRIGKFQSPSFSREKTHALALARTLKLPLWSNDRDFAWPGLKRFTTAEPLKALDKR
jgi:hypothetical protein